MSRTVVLHEYDSTVVELPDGTARALASIAPDAVRVAPARQPGTWRLSADKYVGSITVDGLRVLVRPKIRPENVFLFLGAGLPDAAWRAEAFDYAERGDLLPAVLSFFARTVETTLAGGLLRAYQRRAERLATVRGRIDFAAQVRCGALDLPVACRFDEYTADNEENRYAKAAIRRALRTPELPPPDRRRLLRALAALEEVADVDPRPEAIDRLVFTRLNQHYRPMLRLAEMILRNLSLVDALGRRSASAFLIDMPDLFERFLTERLASVLRGRLTVVAQSSLHLGVGGRIPLRPDLVLRRGADTVGVADVKYKVTDDARARGEDYRQLLAYAVALGLDHGVLIYCRTSGSDIGEGHTTVVHLGTQLHVHAIDASGPPEQMTGEIAVLADAVAGYCRQAARPREVGQRLFG